MDCAKVIHPTFSAGRRIVAISDIHGNLPFLKNLLHKISFSPDDILVLVGDILEKGQHSLSLLRYVMQLSATHTVYPLRGNCDGIVAQFFETQRMDQSFFADYLPKHPESTICQMAQEGGFFQLEDLPLLRSNLRAAFANEWQWLRALPDILETEHLVFVHGGVPSLENMHQLARWSCLKNDDFLGQNRSFDKWVIVGHWPVTLYRADIPSAAPIILQERKIISIDGACVLKLDGQLNALIIDDEQSQQFSWQAWDGLPVYKALDAQAGSTDSINIRWGRSRIEVLERGEELSLCRHVESGRILQILNRYLHEDVQGVWCEDATDYALAVQRGDSLSLVASTKSGYLCKKDGVTGWYYGRLSAIL